MCEHYRKTWYEINLDALVKNYRLLRTKVPHSTLIPVVKADAYGHGALKIVETLRQEGVQLFAVSLLEEALEIRVAYADVDILMMGVLSPEQLPIVEKNNIIFTLSDYELYDAAKRYSGPLRFHIKFDSGMNRLGFKDEKSVKTVIESFATSSQKRVEGLYSHLATSDCDEDYVNHQFNRFQQLISSLSWVPKIVHLSNSSAWFKYEQAFKFCTHARIGISLYGYSLENLDYGLTPIGTLKTQISQIKQLARGDYLGYGITYQASEPTRIGVLPIGYADGWIRKHKGGQVEINNQIYPIVGNICMDQMFVKIDASIHLWDTVTLMGSLTITADDLAKRLQTIHYEILCLISNRVPRVYLKEDPS